MQRLYAMFPDGRPGFGLVLLRMYLVLTLLGTFGDAPGIGIGVGLGLLTAGLLLGLLVQVLAAVFAMGSLWCAAQLGVPWAQALPVLLVSLAVLCLGPGAYSLDAQLFGRRIVTERRPPP
ncbi:hypothetical protein [Pseudoxanthomonas sp.]|uniref:hypothetical protein n=1 Tax=Pseudoxanthomonas sp. TaxID=1871049 RepID=UPI0026049B1A|nr:hypothetical protein [Pseudoxanthomonas sp.]WDS36499.1 MAG: hypothetical protein O8I58_00760 [Pseudoxanthomonas sp.]